MRLAVIFLLSLLLTGCGAVGVKNKLEAQLMPETIAKKKVLARYFGEDWANNPKIYLFADGFQMFCKANEATPIKYSDINVLRYFKLNELIGSTGKDEIRVQKMNWLLVAVPCKNGNYTIEGNYTEQDVADIVDALTSLGATIDEVKRQ